MSTTECQKLLGFREVYRMTMKANKDNISSESGLNEHIGQNTVELPRSLPKTCNIVKQAQMHSYLL